MLGLNICNIRLVGRLLFTNEKTGLCEPYIGLGVSTRNSFLTFVFFTCGNRRQISFNCSDLKIKTVDNAPNGV